MVRVPYADPAPDYARDMREHLRTQRLLGNMRLRILAAMVMLLAFSYGVSLVLLRNVLVERLDVEISTALARELEEFRLLAAGTDPLTGKSFGDDLEAVFDLYYAREVPDEGETLLTFVDRDPYRTEADSSRPIMSLNARAICDASSRPRTGIRWVSPVSVMVSAVSARRRSGRSTRPASTYPSRVATTIVPARIRAWVVTASSISSRSARGKLAAMKWPCRCPAEIGSTM